MSVFSSLKTGINIESVFTNCITFLMYANFLVLLFMLAQILAGLYRCRHLARPADIYEGRHFFRPLLMPEELEHACELQPQGYRQVALVELLRTVVAKLGLVTNRRRPDF